MRMSDPMERKKEKPNISRTSHGRGRKRQKRQPARRSLVLTVIMSVLFIIFCYSGYRLTRDLLSNYRDKKGFAELAAIVAQGAEATTPPVSAEIAASGVTTEPATELITPADSSPLPNESTEPTPAPEPTPNLKYAPLYEMNSEYFGWLTIEGLEIDYPVMYAPTRSEYYLNRDFYGEYSNSGVPFIDGRCPSDGNYYLIYGHKMINGSIFGRLTQYAEEDCWRENPVIRFDTMYEERQYAIMACFYSRLFGEHESGFRYYQYFDLTEEAVFKEYVAQTMASALYDTGVTAEYGDELLVLSTCSHHTSDGRFVVVAKRIA